MNTNIPAKIILEDPPPGVDFGIQKGSGNKYETIQLQRSTTGDLHFEFTITLRSNTGNTPDFSGPIVQGPPNGRFIYVDIGTYAGVAGAAWSRRLKIPLTGITTQMVKSLLSGTNIRLTRKVPGTGKDGGPNCATVKPFPGWHLSGPDSSK